MTAFNLIKSLTKRGNVVLGSGCYSAAIASNNNNQVIKIGNNMSDPWIDYYHSIVKSNQTNPHVPKIKSFSCFEEHSYYVCVMEKLDEQCNNDIFCKKKTTIVELCRDYTTSMITREEFVESCKPFSAEIPCPIVLADLLDKIKEGTDIFDYEYVPEDCYSYKRLDMHNGNFMFRDGVLVVIDPWCEYDTTDIVDVSEWVDSMSRKTKTTSTGW